MFSGNVLSMDKGGPYNFIKIAISKSENAHRIIDIGSPCTVLGLVG